MTSPINLPTLCLSCGVNKSNRTLGPYTECLGLALELEPSIKIALFGTGDLQSTTCAIEDSAAACGPRITSYAAAAAYVRTSLGIAAMSAQGRYYPSRLPGGLAGCVQLEEVSAESQGPALLAAAMLVHQRTAIACGLEPLSLHVHIARLILRAQDSDLTASNAASVHASQLHVC